jgi:hypothetical protein
LHIGLEKNAKLTVPDWAGMSTVACVSAGDGTGPPTS